MERFLADPEEAQRNVFGQILRDTVFRELDVDLVLFGNSLQKPRMAAATPR